MGQKATITTKKILLASESEKWNKIVEESSSINAILEDDDHNWAEEIKKKFARRTTHRYFSINGWLPRCIYLQKLWNVGWRELKLK